MYPVAEDTPVCSLHIHRNFKIITKSVHFVQANLRKDWSGFRVGWSFRPGPTPLLGLGSLTCQIWAPAVASMQHGHEYSTRTCVCMSKSKAYMSSFRPCRFTKQLARFSVGGWRNLCLPSDKNSLAWFLASLLPYTHGIKFLCSPDVAGNKAYEAWIFTAITLFARCLCILPTTWWKDTTLHEKDI